MEKDYLKRVGVCQMFLKQFLQREVNLLGQVFKLRKNVIDQLLKMLMEELLKAGKKVHAEQLCVQMTGAALEVWYRKHKDASSAQTIWKFVYKSGAVQTFPKNDPHGLLDVIEPFLKMAVLSGAEELSELMGEIEAELESAEE